MISDIMGKPEHLSGFDTVQIVNHSVIGDVDIGNDSFGELFTCSRSEQVSKVVYDW